MARTGTATVFPHTIAMAAFDPELLEQVTDAIFTEGPAKYNKFLEFGDRDICKNLTYRFPNINIFRDPRWRKGQETYGEGPFLCKGLQSGGKPPAAPSILPPIPAGAAPCRKAALL